MARKEDDGTQYFDLDPITGGWTLPDIPIPRKIFVDDNGFCDLFREGIAKVPFTMREFLHESREIMIFKIPSPDALRRFYDLISAPLTPGGSLAPCFRIEIDLMPTEVSGDDLAATWGMSTARRPPTPRNVVTSIHMAHGYESGFREHIGAWMDAVQILPSTVAIDVVIQFPWRDYRSLHRVTEPLRKDEREFRLRLHVEPAQRSLPEHDLHINLFIASLKATKCVKLMEDDQEVRLSEATAQRLIRQGCRGFRRWLALE